jgi:hypothetical protein
LLKQKGERSYSRDVHPRFRKLGEGGLVAPVLRHRSRLSTAGHGILEVIECLVVVEKDDESK